MPSRGYRRRVQNRSGDHSPVRRGGANVVVDEDGARAVIEAAGGVAESVPTDVTDADDVEALIEVIIETFGSVDALVNISENPAG